MVLGRRRRSYSGSRRRVRRRVTRIRRRLGRLSLYRRYRRYGIYRALRMPMGMFPARKTVSLRYVENFTLNAGNGSTASYVFRVNGAYDPNYSSTGHQPMFFDTYSAIYGSYKVCMASITFICTDNHIVNVGVPDIASGTTTGATQYYAANERACRMFILRDNEVNDYTTMLNTMIEEGNKNFVWRFAPQNTSMGMSKLRLRCWPHKQLNLSYNDNTLNAATNSNPASEAYFICGIDSMPGTNPDNMNFQAIVTYKITFFDLKKNQSEQ